MPQEPGSRYEKALIALGSFVLIVWGIAVLVQVAFPSHPAPEAVNIVTPIVATGLFGGAIVAGRKKNGGS